METPPIKTRRTRFVCISDTHNSFPGGGFKLPPGDVLVHAGDLTNQGSFEELQKAVKWLEEADYECKIVVGGNHDVTLDSPFYAQYGLYFHNQDPQNADKCQALLLNSPSITYLRHAAETVKLRSPNGPHTQFKVFGSPYSPASGMWAFSYTTEEAPQFWNKIPLDTDVLVTHTPPKFHLDERADRRAVGCECLRETLWRVRPQLHVAGHVHESRGAEIIRWDLTQSNVKYKEEDTTIWNDPGAGTKKFSIVNLTAKNGGINLQNDGAAGHFLNMDKLADGDGGLIEASERLRRKTTNFTFTADDAFKGPELPKRSKSARKAKKEIQKVDVGVAKVSGNLAAIPAPTHTPATLGQGGMPPSGRCDLEALSGRLGRLETCVVNAAIMADSWPRRGGKKFNKPIVVDIDLPVWYDNG